MQTHTKCVPDDNEYNKSLWTETHVAMTHAYLIPMVEVVCASFKSWPAGINQAIFAGLQEMGQWGGPLKLIQI